MLCFQRLARWVSIRFMPPKYMRQSVGIHRGFSIGHTRKHLVSAGSMAVILIAVLFTTSDAAAAPASYEFGWKVVGPAPSIFSPGNDSGRVYFAYPVTNFAWDPVEGYMMAVILVVANLTSNYVAHTVALENGKWVELHIRTPRPLDCLPNGNSATTASLVWDASDGYMLLIDDFSINLDGDCHQGYSGATSRVLTWAFENGFWNKIPDTTGPYLANGFAPDAEESAIFTYDASDGMVLDLGDCASPYYSSGEPCVAPTNQLFGFRAGVWKELTSLPGNVGPGGSFLFDPGIGKALLISNGYWTFHANSWERISPMNRPNGFFVSEAGYDPSLHALIAETGTYIECCVFFPPVSGIWIWQDGSAGFAEITAKTLNKGVACIDWSTSEAIPFDPELNGLFCQGFNGEFWAFS
jgi:hypothetical protein